MATKVALSKLQQSIVDFDDGALLVVAGPGSGKTRVLTERVRRLLSEGGGRFRVLALTFTNKAANEMKSRLTEFRDIDRRAFIGTLHSFCTEVLGSRGKAIGLEELPVIFESADDRRQVLRQSAMEDPELRQRLSRLIDTKAQRKLLDEWLEMIRDHKSSLTLAEAVEDDDERHIYETYDAALRGSNAIDFDDILLLAYQLLEEHPKIADFYRRQFKYICIDEAQDLNEAQYGLLCALCGDSYRNVMLVGDPKQAIFVFNGASPRYLERFGRDFDAKRVELNENYRCSQQVVKAAQALDPNYDVGVQMSLKGDVILIAGNDEADEARQVADVLSGLFKNGHKDIEGPIKPEQCAILARTRYALSDVETDIKSRNWPYYRYLSSQHESESDCVTDFELCMRLVANPSDRLHARMLAQRWSLSNWESNGKVSVRDINMDELGSEEQAVLNAIRALGADPGNVNFTKALDQLDQYANSVQRLNERAQIMEDVKSWRRHWDHYVRAQRGGEHGLQSFLTQVALGSTQQPALDGIGLLTVHSAKGLEFDIVCVMGLADGVFPDYRASGSALAEERRNAFVAVTRSRRVLILSYPKRRRMPWGDIRPQQASEYFEEVREAF